MSTQRTDSGRLNAAAPFKSLAAGIPPELFRNILVYVGDQDRLGYSDFGPYHLLNVDQDARREEMKQLAACALTCVYWAQSTRERMFRRVILHSYKDMSRLLSLISEASQSPRIPPICDILRYLDVVYTLGDHSWLYTLASLAANRRVIRLAKIYLHITGPATPALPAASTRGSLLHPLFFTAPRILPVVFPYNCDVVIDIRSIHLPNPTVLCNLIQDCLSLWPLCINCTNLTWDIDPVLQATPSSFGLKYICLPYILDDDYSNKASGCTDNVLVATMLNSIPYHEFPLRHQGAYLSPLESSGLFDAMRTTWSWSSPERDRTEQLRISSYDRFANIWQESVMTEPSPGSCIEWNVGDFLFICTASPLPHASAAAGNNVRNITYIIIDLSSFESHHHLRSYMKTTCIDWDTFLCTVQQFLHLQQVIIQQRDVLNPESLDPRQILVEFLAHLGEAWFGLGELLKIHGYDIKQDELEWVQLRLSDTTVMDEIKQTREEIKAEAEAAKAASRKLESSVDGGESGSSTHTGNE